MKTVAAGEYIGEDALGFMINAAIDTIAARQISELQETLKLTYGDALWLTPANALHITLVDWLAPLSEYPDDKEKLLGRMRGEYERALRLALQGIPIQTLSFDKILVSPSAIVITADASRDLFNSIRAKFLDTVTLLPGTKTPPKITHATIGRFVREIDMSPMPVALDGPIGVTIDEFRLVKETKLPMLEYEVLNRYALRA